MNEKSKWQVEFDALPEWAQKMVRAAADCIAYGSERDRSMLSGATNPERYTVFQMAISRDAHREWCDGFCDMMNLAEALTAPWPPPSPPLREKRVLNVVELMDDEQAFDQPCAFGNRCGGHAVYCHNDAWPNAPRKCRRSKNDPEWRHEDCPGFVANPDVNPDLSW